MKSSCYRGLVVRGCVRGDFFCKCVCFSVSVVCVCVCVYLERTLTDSPPHTVSGTELFKKWRSAGCSPPSGTLIEHTPDLQSVLSQCTGKKGGGKAEVKSEGCGSSPSVWRKDGQHLCLSLPLTAVDRDFRAPASLCSSQSTCTQSVWRECGVCVCVSCKQTQAVKPTENTSWGLTAEICSRGEYGFWKKHLFCFC